jgi:hypothetical protein
LMPRIQDAFILNEIHGSDHCPVGVEILWYSIPVFFLKANLTYRTINSGLCK